MNTLIFHLALPQDAGNLADSGVYRAASLESEGFIHCANAEQLPGVIQRYYANADDLVLLCIDANLLGNDLVMENTVGGDELFPHVYATISATAVIKTQRLDAAGLKAIALGGAAEGDS